MAPPFEDEVSDCPPLFTVLSLKDVFNNLPRGQRLWRPELLVQLRTWYADWAGYGVACLHPRTYRFPLLCL